MSEKKRENAAGAAGAEDRDLREETSAAGEGADQREPLVEGAEAVDAAAAGAADPDTLATGAAAAPGEAADDGPGDAAEDAATDPVLVLEEEVAQLREDLAAERDRLLRTVAEMDNLRKRSRREVQEAHRFARAEALRPMLEVLDNFDRALAHADQNGGTDGEAADAAAAGTDAAAFRQGVGMIAQSFRQALRDQGVEPIAAVGEEFDPARHEAVGQQPAPEGTESGTVIAVVQEGYSLGDLVLRASRVIVAQ